MKKIILFFRIIAVSPVYFYKLFISPLLTRSCRYTPTCSIYCIRAVKEFGVIKGYIIGMKRLFSCHSKSKRNCFDPVPINIKGDSKWLL
ncbi:MAG: membrane protein insertion efficiency factor YidD [Clostridia bacterium]|nr:membrane protein insertion efficiency factor YidD [Clostridia bacterium]